ncbi:hypothetical protein PG993_006665 [Apiospora rasikravindrae]|uniref:Protein kinase domain-containing protein n=1 Tax=Apiospora rasikravindrae TaxID=990691 RepID=A0ABR1T6T7_9PEZI
MSSFSETIDDMNTSSGGSSIDPNHVTDRLQEVKKYFTNEGLQFRKVIAQGNHGGAVLFDQWLPIEPAAGSSSSNNNNAPPPQSPTSAPQPTMQRRQLVVKYALDTQEDASSDNDADLRNEFGWLRRFRGAEHIIQILPEYNHLWRTNNNNQSSDEGPVLSRPVIVMEYLENGTLDQLIERFGRIERRIPQRLIWSFALCLLRAVAAISYPNQLDGRRRREVARDEPPSLITQNSSLHGTHVPPLHKYTLFSFCSFPLTRRRPPKNQVLQDLVDAPNDRDLYLEADYRVWRASQSAVFDPYDFSTSAHALVLTDERLDKALRDLIAMCLAGQSHELPTLREFLTLGRAGRRKTAEQFRHLYDNKMKTDDEGQTGGQDPGQGQNQNQGPNQGQNQGQGRTEATDGEEWLCETDEAISELLQRIVFDADFDPQRYSDVALHELGVTMTAEFLATLSIET